MKLRLATSIGRFRSALGVVIGLAAAFGALARYPTAVAHAAGGLQQEQISPQEQADCLPAATARSVRNSRTGALRFIGTAPGRPIAHPSRLQASGSPAAAARSYLSVCARLFGLRDTNAELSLVGTERPDARRSVVRFRQMHQGVPVVGGELIVHLDASNNILALGGKTLPDVTIQTTPAIPEATARAQALSTVAKAQGVDPTLLIGSTPELSIYDPRLMGPDTGETTLVWRVEVTPLELLPIRELVLVDALRGSVVLHFNQVEDALDRRTYTALNQPTLPGSLVCNESNPSCAGGDSHAVGAHLSGADTYNFYLSMHGRNGIDNAGMTITSTVHYSQSAGVPYHNAFWNGSQMVYGDGAGYPLADDVVAHELTHGVTDYTSRLFYFYQSGAINESFSDVWGEFVDQTNGRGDDSAAVKWLIGEDVAGEGALRSMSNPTSFGDPDRMTSPFYYRGSDNNVGVHTNSGINNKAAFLMVDGGSFNGRSITGLGITKTAKIYYEVQTHLLTSGSDYADLYEALYQGCNNLVGTSGISSFDCQQVRNATLAVEMNQQPGAAFNPDAPFCPLYKAPSNLFFDNLESGSGNWQMVANTGTSRWRYDSPYDPFAHSGSHFLYANDFPEAISDSYIRMAAGVTLPAGAFLHFAHAFAFETPNFDGGVVEYSTNGGSSWTDAGNLFDVNGYTGTLITGTGNPLGGRSGFIADSHGYISSRLNLASLAGQNVRFRWRMGLDELGTGGFNSGWWLDDIRIYTCVDPAITAAPATVLPGGAVTVNVTNDPGDPADWVGLYSASAADNGGYIAWAYLNNTQTAPAIGTAGATLQFNAPITPGTYNFRLFASGTLTKIATSGTVTVLTVPTLTIDDASVTEGNGGTTTAIFNVRLAPTSPDPVTVNYATANGTAIAGSDYVAAAGMLTFPPGAATQTIAVSITPDLAIESNETFLVNLSGAVGAPLGRAQGVGTIVNDDLPPAPSVTASAATFNGGETITVTVANGPANRGDWVALVPTAAADSGYVAWAYLNDTQTVPGSGTPSATLHFTAPLTTGTYNFRFFAGGLRIATSATVTVLPPPPPALGVSATAVNAGDAITVTVTNGPANLGDWVALYPAAAADTGYIAWAYLSDSHTPPGSGMANATLHFTAPQTPGPYNFRFFTTGFTKIATSATVTVLTVPTLRIEDVNVTEGDSGTTTATFTVTLAPTSPDPVTVNYATANGTAIAGSDYVAAAGMLTFPPGTATQPIAVSITPDLAIEPNETFLVNLSGAVGAPLGRAQGVGTIVNDDLPPAPSVTASAATFNGGETITVTVANGPANRGDWVALVPTAAADSGYVAWAYLNDTQTVPGSGTPSATLHFIAPLTTGTYNFRFFAGGLRIATSATVTVLPPPPPALGVSATAVTAGDAITVTVTNGPANLGDWVALYPAAAADTGYIAWAYLSDSHTPPGSGMANATLHFTAPQTPGPYNFRFFATGFTKIATSATVTVLTVPTLRIEDVNVTEGDSGTTTATFTVTLAPTSPDPVTVNYATANGTAIAGSDYVAAAGMLTFPPGTATQPIAVSITPDLAIEPNETFLVNLSGAVGAPLGRAQGVGTIVNDDLPPAPSVTASAATFNGGETITVTVANGPANRGDWVALVPTAAADSGYVAWAYLNDTQTVPGSGIPSATLHFTAPLTTGTYNFRFFAGGLRISTSATVTVLPPPPPALGVSATTVQAGDAITVTVTNGPANLGDWVALYPAAAADTGYIAWAYLSDTHALPASGIANATLHFTAPQTPGPYNFRFFATGLTKIATSATVTVQTVPTLTISDVNVTEGNFGTTTATFTVTLAPTSADTVTVYYTTADGTATFGNTDYVPTSGTLTFTPSVATQTLIVIVNGDMGIEPNETFFVNLLFPTNAQIGDSQGVGIIINDDAPPGPSVTALPTTVNPGDTITVSVANGPGTRADWVSLGSTAAADNVFLDWFYLNNSKTAPMTGATSANLQFTAPMTPGTYNFRLFTNNTYTKLATSPTVLVAQTSGKTLWSPNGEPVSTAEGGQGISWSGRPGVSLVPDGAGGALIAWADLEADSVFADHLDAAGHGLWGSGGVAVADAAGYKFLPAAVSDGAGGLIVAWVDGQNDPYGANGSDIVAQRFDASGNRLWGANGVAVTAAAANQGQSGLAIVSDGANGAIVAWEDGRPTCCRYFAQRIDHAGVAVWTPDGVPVEPPAAFLIGPINAPPLAISDGAGGAIIAYLNIHVNVITDHPRVALQHLDANGQPQWPLQGLWVGLPASTDFGALTTDGAGGAIVAWSERVGATLDEVILAQRVSPSGVLLWPSSGITVASAPYLRGNLAAAADGAGGALLVWEDARDFTSGDCCNIYGQRLSAAGQRLWPATGVPISTAVNNQNSPLVTADGAGGAIVVWQDCRDHPTGDECGFGLDLYAQRVSAGGTLRWAGGLPVSIAPGNQGIAPGSPNYPVVAMVTDGAGGAIVAWPDGRNSLCQQLTPECDLYAQRINEDGGAVEAVDPPK